MPEVSILTPAAPGVFHILIFLPVGVIVDNVDVTFTPYEHDGFEMSHWNTNLYFIIQKERRKLVSH